MATIRESVQPFAIQPTIESAWLRAAIGVASPAIERLLGLTALGRMYADATGPSLIDDFPERALAYLDISWKPADKELARVPSTGPLVVVANHPLGAADGLALLAIVRSVRRDVRLLGNYLLERLPELRPLVIAVDPSGGPEARAANRTVVRRAADWVQRGGALIVFPAGEVSSVRAPGGRLIDGPWKPGVARIVAETGAPVLPVHFDGRNSRTFELAGRLHPALRTALLPRELLARRGRAIRAVIGTPIDAARLAPLASPADVTAYLRARTYALGANRPVARPAAAPVAPPGDAALIERDVRSLPADRRLATHRALSVFYARAAEIPAVIEEIGRLRELTFRAVGEGTGQASDLDRFDAHYLHLFLWDEERRLIAGAYRLAPTDVVVSERGLSGLYTRTLFHYGRRFLTRLGPALELGRSFVRAEYQRDFGALMLLWQGIGRFVVRHPRYQRLFGPVSVSAAYTDASRDAIVDVLEHPSVRSPLGEFVRPRHPYCRVTTSEPSPFAADRAAVHRLVGDVEPDGSGLPVLLRHYMKLHARTLAVSVDPDFAHVVDALVVVDVETLDAAVRRRYLG